jgi:RNA-directed DNA polymerase
VDRLIQQAVMQVLQRRWDPTFSEHSHGFRPKRSAHQAVAKAQQYIAAGHRWVVDLDLEKFFDRVNHDKLMAAISRRVTDKRVLRLIGAFLKVGVLENGLVSPAEEGTPQGGPLSPLLSNIVLDELDRELERRKHCFVRYADDCNIYVRSQRAGQRVMTNVTRFLTRRLKLKVNEAKSALLRCRQKIRELTRRTRGISLEQMLKELTAYLRGWKSYFGFCQTPSLLKALDEWIRRRLRSMIWKQWKRGKQRYAKLRHLGIRRDLAAQTAGSPHGPWHLANSPALSSALPIAYFDSLALPRLFAGDA